MWPIHKAYKPNPGAASQGLPIMLMSLTPEQHQEFIRPRDPHPASEELLTQSSGTRGGFSDMQTRLIRAAFLPDTEQTHADKTAKTRTQMNSHLHTLHAAPHILYSNNLLVTITKCCYKPEMSAVTCVFIIGKCTQLLASSVASEQCWQLRTSSTRDT